MSLIPLGSFPFAFAMCGEDGNYGADENILFQVLGNQQKEENTGSVFVMVASILWGILDTLITAFSIFKRLPHIHSGGFCMAIVIVIIFSVPYAILVWPISNFLRVADALIVIFFRSREFPCHRKDFNCLFFLFDVFGTACGFLMTYDPLWEKIVSVLIECVDAVFSLMIALSNVGIIVSLGIRTQNFLVILKIVALSVKVTLSLKNYLSVRRYIPDLIIGAIFGIGLFVTLLLLQLRNMELFSGSYVVLVFPFIGMEVIFSLVVLFGIRPTVYGDDRLTGSGGTEDYEYYHGEGGERTETELETV